MQQRWGRVRMLASVWASNWRRKAHVSLGQGCSSEGLVNNALNNYRGCVPLLLPLERDVHMQIIKTEASICMTPTLRLCVNHWDPGRCLGTRSGSTQLLSSALVGIPASGPRVQLPCAY